jgi:hypothetical protein
MARRPKRSDDLIDREQLLAALKSCRHDLAISMSRMQINGPLYVAASELLCSIDAVAVVLTNRADFFHAQPHGSRPTSP